MSSPVELVKDVCTVFFVATALPMPCFNWDNERGARFEWSTGLLLVLLMIMITIVRAVIDVAFPKK